jgi:hypothetical protein
MADISALTVAALRAIASRALAGCCDDCRAILRDQLRAEEFDSDSD